MLTVDDLKSNKKMPHRRRNCMECDHYRALSFTDDGAPAWCGRCILPSPCQRLRKVRDAMSPACPEFQERGDGRRGGEA